MELQSGKRYKTANGKEVYLCGEQEQLPAGILVRVYIGVVKDGGYVLWYYEDGSVKNGAPTNYEDYKIVECIDDYNLEILLCNGQNIVGKNNKDIEIKRLEKENTKLKWLLKESRNRIDKYINIFQNEGSFYSRNLVKQIDEVLK